MAYIAGDADEEEQHATYCDMMTHGPAVKLASPESAIWSERDQRVLLITDDSPEDQRILAHNTSRVANREMGYDGGIYRSYDPPDERQIRIYLFIQSNRVIGLLLLERRTTVWLCRWGSDSETSPACEERPDIPWMWSVGFMWAQADHRRSGLSNRLLQVGLGDLNLSTNTVGWYTPFSDAGEKFVQHQCPVSFYVAK
jgi:hypothetical protein